MTGDDAVGEAANGPGMGLPPIQAICDGSDDVRFLYAVMDGIASFQQYADTRFGTPYFVAIDGRCNYWFGGNGSVEGIRGGRLDVERASQLSEELQFGRYGSVAGFRDGAACTDALRVLLSDGTGVLDGSSCSGSDSDAPSVWSEAFGNTGALTLELDELGEPRWEPTRMTISHVGGVPYDRMIHPWAAPLELAPLAVDLAYGEGRPDSDSFSVLVEDELTLGMLEALRRAELAAKPNAPDVYVRDAKGQFYRLALRDVGPAKVVRALQGLLTTPEY